MSAGKAQITIDQEVVHWLCCEASRISLLIADLNLVCRKDSDQNCNRMFNEQGLIKGLNGKLSLVESLVNAFTAVIGPCKEAHMDYAAKLI